MSVAGVTAPAPTPVATWACAHAHDSRRSGSSVATADPGTSITGSGPRLGMCGGATTARSTQMRTSHGRSRWLKPGEAGVKIHGKSGGSNSTAGR